MYNLILWNNFLKNKKKSDVRVKQQWRRSTLVKYSCDVINEWPLSLRCYSSVNREKTHTSLSFGPNTTLHKVFN